MIDEHAVAFKDKLYEHQLEYLIRKANRLGLSNRAISHMYQINEENTTHIYFKVEGMEQYPTAVGG